MNLIKSLTGLRGYAALLVYIAHMYHFNYFGLPPWVGSVLERLGPGGVSLFFVLSGFVLFINYPYKELKFKNFYVARFARIYPAYFLGIIFAIPLEVFSPNKSEQMVSFIANVFLIQQFFPTTAGTFNDVGWTLCVEAFFYLLFPVIAVVLVRGSLYRSLALGAAVLVATLSVAWGLFPSFYSTYHFPPNRLFEFLIGISGGLFYSQHRFSKVSTRILLSIFWSGIVSFFAVALMNGPLALFSLTPQVLFGVASGIIVLSLAQLERQGFSHVLLTSHFIIFCGEISYAFYLLHNLVLRYFQHGVRFIFSQNIQDWPILWSLGSALGLFLITAVCSVLVFRYLEIPARRTIRRVFNPLPETTVS